MDIVLTTILQFSLDGRNRIIGSTLCTPSRLPEFSLVIVAFCTVGTKNQKFDKVHELF